MGAEELVSKWKYSCDFNKLAYNATSSERGIVVIQGQQKASNNKGLTVESRKCLRIIF